MDFMMTVDPTVETRRSNVSKCNILFDKTVTHWCSFKPKNGADVFPCYACRDMFSGKGSYLDHVNRRGLQISYICKHCCLNSNMTFYNPCSFLLHARSHFSNTSGEIDLNNVKISMLPSDLVGLLPHPDITMLYNVEEDYVGDVQEISTRFYSPTQESIGESLIVLIPIILMFDDSSNSDLNMISTRLVLHQVSSNIAHCKFVKLPLEQIISNIHMSNSNYPVIKIEPEYAENIHTEIDLPVSKLEVDQEKHEEVRNQGHISPIKKLKHYKSKLFLPKCPECNLVQKTSMTEHFLKQNKPFNEILKCIVCKFVAPTACSLQAHSRIHDQLSPYICPECGRDFNNSDYLMDHLDDVCFHLAKQVRFRCPARNCGKIFAQTQTYSAHFMLHMMHINRCIICDENFLNDEQFFEHMKQHASAENNSEKIFKCTVCKETVNTFNGNDYMKHIQWHCTDRTNCVYVYLCKFCRSYCRSTLTYATHLLRCSKKWTEDIVPQNKKLVTNCLKCNIKLQLDCSTTCPGCGEILSGQDESSYSRGDSIPVFDEHDSISDDTIICQLCDSAKHNTFSKKCKYSNPQVVLKKLHSEHTESSASDSSLLEVKQEVIDLDIETFQIDKRLKITKPDDSMKVKRRKVITNKSNSGSHEKNYNDDPEQPIPFTGVYNCKICDYCDENQKNFHEHIKTHRDVLTSYQCMECGECFVVKPSLLKHLLYYHQISNVERYIEENNCYDKTAVKDLEKSTKFLHIIPEEPVAENQCRVCKHQFSNNLELSKHFRIHGMAFLMQNYK